MEREPRKTSSANCPICGRSTDARYRPFCSRRCADIDLSRWLRGAYAIPDESKPDEADLSGADEPAAGEEQLKER